MTHTVIAFAIIRLCFVCLGLSLPEVQILNDGHVLAVFNGTVTSEATVLVGEDTVLAVLLGAVQNDVRARQQVDGAGKYCARKFFLLWVAQSGSVDSLTKSRRI